MNILDKKAFYEAEDSLMRLEQAKDLSLLICRKVNDAIGKGCRLGTDGKHFP